MSPFIAPPPLMAYVADNSLPAFVNVYTLHPDNLLRLGPILFKRFNLDCERPGELICNAVEGFDTLQVLRVDHLLQCI